mgnify:FL=1|tara:strand:+ start:967 stop:1287 length:321 start_codon:yes stop_codon:yes gene_type:complete
MATKIEAKYNIEQVVKWKWDIVCNCKYTNDGETWEIYNWESETPQPSREEIEAEIPNYQAVLDGKHYKLERAVEYPSIQDQLDDLYHNGIDGWKATIKAVKDKYPK